MTQKLTPNRHRMVNKPMISDTSSTLGGEGWPAADVAEGPENRKSCNDSSSELAGPSQERAGNVQINRHTVDTRGSQDVPVTARQFERWLVLQDQSGWPDDLVSKAEIARLCFMVKETPAYDKSPALQDSVPKAIHAFANAYAEWKR